MGCAFPMTLSIDVSMLSPAAQKITSVSAPPKLQEMAAKGIAPGIRPGEMIAVLILLARSENAAVRETAGKTLGALPEQLLNGALATELHPAALDAIARVHMER